MLYITVQILVVVLVLLDALPSSAFQSSQARQIPMRRSKVVLSAETANDDDDDIFAMEAWKPIKQNLDQIPIFTVATAEGHPLAYKIENARGTFEVPTFYCDVDEAKKELADVQGGMEKDADTIKLRPFPLGTAFELWGKSQAMIIPGKNAILQAGAPPDTNPIGQNVPLFGCMNIMEPREDGKPVLPLFLSLEDANAALEKAVTADGENIDDFEVTAMSLNQAVEVLVSDEDSPGFHFLAPSKSIAYVNSLS